jgi:MFS transporter, DHA1 family, tetracycline resistance protein
MVGGSRLHMPSCNFCLHQFPAPTNWRLFVGRVVAGITGASGYSLGMVGLLVFLVQGLLIRKIIPWLGNEKSVYTGLFLYSIGLILFGIANQGWMMFAFSIFYCVGGIAGPALQGIISNQVPGNEQGELQCGLASLMSVTSIIGPPLMTTLFAGFTRPGAELRLPGEPFMAGSLLTLLSTVLAYRSFKKTS